MPYWTRITVHERLVQLLEDLQLVGERALALDSASGGSVGLPDEQFGSWKMFALAMAGEEQTPASHRERLSALAARLPLADDQVLAEGRSDVLWAYEDLHRSLSLVEPWIHPSEPHRVQALALRKRMAGAEDEAHRVVAGIGDLRRNLRRARARG